MSSERKAAIVVAARCCGGDSGTVAGAAGAASEGSSSWMSGAQALPMKTRTSSICMSVEVVRQSGEKGDEGYDHKLMPARADSLKRTVSVDLPAHSADDESGRTSSAIISTLPSSVSTRGASPCAQTMHQCTAIEL